MARKRKRPMTRGARLFVAAFAGSIAWMLTAFFVLGVIPSLWEYRASASWPSVEGVVVDSHTERARSGGRRGAHTSRPYVQYRFSVDGREYLGDRYTLSRSGDNSGSAQRIVNQHPEGSSITVHYDPSDPNRSIVHPGFDFGAWLAVGLAVVFGGGAMVATAWFIHTLWCPKAGAGVGADGRLPIPPDSPPGGS